MKILIYFRRGSWVTAIHTRQGYRHIIPRTSFEKACDGARFWHEHAAAGTLVRSQVEAW